MSRFSIVLPVYNVAPYLRECLNSIREQSERDWECICVDDGSNDGSGEIIDEYQRLDGRFRALHKKNGGVSSARNLGLENISKDSEWFFLVDSDDYLDCDYIAHLYSLVKRDGEKVVGCVGWRQFHNGTNHFEKCAASLANGIYEPISARASFGSGPIWAKIYPCRVLRESNMRFFDSVRLGEDVCWMNWFISKCKRLVVDNDYVGVNYRLLPNTISHGHSAIYIAREYLRAVAEMFNVSDGMPYDYLMVLLVVGVTRHAYRLFSIGEVNDFVSAVRRLPDAGVRLWSTWYNGGEQVEYSIGARDAALVSREYADAFCRHSMRYVQVALVLWSNWKLRVRCRLKRILKKA